MNDQLRQSLLDGEGIGARYTLSIPQQSGHAPAGVRMGSRAGRSIEFKDFRDYQPGDDLRWIDWNVYARTDRYTVKLYHEEVSPHLDLVLDTSKSMGLEDTPKAQAALGLAAVFATAAANAGCTFCCWCVGDDVRRAGNDSARPIGWHGISFDAKRSLAEGFAAHPPSFRRRSVRILLSDLLWPDDPMTVLRPLSRDAARAFVVRLSAASEERPPERGNIRLLDVETNAQIELFVDATAETYFRDALARHTRGWEEACRRTGTRLTSILADDVVGAWDLSPLERAGALEVT